MRLTTTEPGRQPKLAQEFEFTAIPKKASVGADHDMKEQIMHIAAYENWVHTIANSMLCLAEYNKIVSIKNPVWKETWLKASPVDLRSE